MTWIEALDGPQDGSRYVATPYGKPSVRLEVWWGTDNAWYWRVVVRDQLRWNQVAPGPAAAFEPIADLAEAKKRAENAAALQALV